MQTIAWCSRWHLPQRANGCTTVSLEVTYSIPRSCSMLGPVARVAMQLTPLQACIFRCKEQQQYSLARRRCCSRMCTQLQRRGRLHMSRSPVRAASVHFLHAKFSFLAESRFRSPTLLPRSKKCCSQWEVRYSTKFYLLICKRNCMRQHFNFMSWVPRPAMIMYRVALSCRHTSKAAGSST